MRLSQTSRVLYLGDERSERTVVNFQVSAEIAPNAAWNFFSTGHPSAHRALVNAKIARQMCLPLFAVEENANLLKKKTIFAQEGLLPSFVGGANPLPKAEFM
jgi:hypothetical protein